MTPTNSPVPLPPRPRGKKSSAQSLPPVPPAFPDWRDEWKNAEHIVEVQLAREKRRHVRESLHRIDWDAMKSAALIAAWIALLTYEPERVSKAGIWIYSKVALALKEELRDQDHLTRGQRAKARVIYDETGDYPEWAYPPLSFDAPLQNWEPGRSGVEDADTILLGEIQSIAVDKGADVETAVERAWLREQVQAALALLPNARLRHVAREYWIRERLLGAIAVDLGISESRVHQLKNDADRFLRQRLAPLVTEEGKP